MINVDVQKIGEDLYGNLSLENSPESFCSIILVDANNASSNEEAIIHAKSCLNPLLSLSGNNSYRPIRMFLSVGKNMKLGLVMVFNHYVIVAEPNSNVFGSLGVSPSGNYLIKSFVNNKSH
jgi:hypothetical protein